MKWLSATQAAALIRNGSLSPLEFADALIAHIEATEPALLAWEATDFDRLRACARKAGEFPRGSEERQLFGVPIGVKDVIDAEGFATAAGLAPLRVTTRHEDAAVVARLKAAGAMVLGKTVAAQLAYRDVPDTRNPWSERHSAGGSSTGSAVAVAADHVPLALASQTGGSILRPAAYVGVVGFKPTIHRISTKGLFPLAPTLDHVGVIARSVADCALFLQIAQGTPQSTSKAPNITRRRPRVGIVPAVLEEASSEVYAHTASVVMRLSSEGATVVDDIDMPLAEMREVHALIMKAEAAYAHRGLLSTHIGSVLPLARELLEEGSLVTAVAYQGALVRRRELMQMLKGLLGRVDFLLVPATKDLVPLRTTTGDSSLLSPFTLVGVPTVSLPTSLDSSGLPMAVQLVSSWGDDEALLQFAEWCQGILPGPGHPPAIAGTLIGGD